MRLNKNQKKITVDRQSQKKYIMVRKRNSSIMSTVKLSTFGYNIHASEHTRQRALREAVNQLKAETVKKRLQHLAEKYPGPIRKILKSDLSWLSNYNNKQTARKARSVGRSVGRLKSRSVSRRFMVRRRRRVLRQQRR